MQLLISYLTKSFLKSMNSATILIVLVIRYPYFSGALRIVEQKRISQRRPNLIFLAHVRSLITHT